MRFHFSPIVNGICVDIWEGGRLVYIRGFPSVAAACVFIDRIYPPYRKGEK